MMRRASWRGIEVLESEGIVRRRRVEQRLEPAPAVAKKTKPAEFPEPGAIDELFREARRIR